MDRIRDSFSANIIRLGSDGMALMGGEHQHSSRSTHLSHMLNSRASNDTMMIDGMRTSPESYGIEFRPSPDDGSHCSLNTSAPPTFGTSASIKGGRKCSLSLSTSPGSGLSPFAFGQRLSNGGFSTAGHLSPGGTSLLPCPTGLSPPSGLSPVNRTMYLGRHLSVRMGSTLQRPSSLSQISFASRAEEAALPNGTVKSSTDDPSFYKQRVPEESV